MEEYIKYASQEYDKMSKAQEIFIKKYEVNLYENWFYDQESELIRLHNMDGSEIYFKYIPVGTYSLRSNTWMWSWHNEDSIEQHKNETIKTKELGKKYSFKYLTDGLIECEQEECWNLTAISKNLIEGIGVYCTKSDELLKFIIIKEPYLNLESREIRKIKQMKVDCGIHGFRRSAFVCQHLNLEKSKGFEEAFETSKGMELENDDDFAAWCSECEEIRIKNDGWNENSEKFAKIKLVCEECYFELKEFNQ